MSKKAKAGIKTTEFWTSLLAQMVGIAALFGAFTPDQADAVVQAGGMIAGGILQGAGAFGYARARGNAKSNKDE